MKLHITMLQVIILIEICIDYLLSNENSTFSRVCFYKINRYLTAMKYHSRDYEFGG